MGWVIGVIVLVVVILVVLRAMGGGSNYHEDGSGGMDASTKAVLQIQQDYWSPNADELASLSARPRDELSWESKLRLLHLACLDVLSDGTGKEELMGDALESEGELAGPSFDLMKELVTLLSSEESPYRPRPGQVWQGPGSQPGEGDPDMQGILRNASLTHLGCLEVIRLDENEQPSEIGFVPLDDLSGIGFGPPALFRPAILFYDNGSSDEVVVMPLIYGVSWASSNEFDRNGTMTRFVCHIPNEEGESLGIGVGQQDLAISDGEGASLFGLSSVGEIRVPLATYDPRFREKCVARGFDPDEILSSMPKDQE